MAETVITAYKGFEKDLTCNGYQYEIGKEFIQDGEIKLCENGFHACENPLDVLGYYSDINHRFCEVEQSGTIVQGDNKSASSKIKIKDEIGFMGLFNAGIKYIEELTDPSKLIEETKGTLTESGDYAHIGSSGDHTQIGSSGNFAQIGSSGNYAHIDSSGNHAQIGSSGNYAEIAGGCHSVICCAGHHSLAKAQQGSWITLSEWIYSTEEKQYVPKCVKTEFVDGKRIKADTWYKLVDGEFKEAK